MYGVYFLSAHTDREWLFAFSEDDKDIAVKLAHALKSKYHFYAVRCIKNCQLKRIVKTQADEQNRSFWSYRARDTLEMKRKRLATHLSQTYKLDREDLLDRIEKWDRLSQVEQMDQINIEDA